MTPPRRRDAGRSRGKHVEDLILDAALRELAQHGLEGLKVSRVADAADVNKTSVYRKWPEKQDLVAAALQAALVRITHQIKDTGSLETDIEQIVTLLSEQLATPAGRALVQVALADESSAAMAALNRNPSVRDQENALNLIRRAHERGEWDPSITAADAVFTMITGALMHRVLLERQPVTAEWRSTLVGVICRGVRPAPAQASVAPRSPQLGHRRVLRTKASR
jgi:AcrR family transcriptional regulator